MLRLPSLASASSMELKSNLRSSGASGGNVRGSTGCNCRHETRRLASYDAGQAEYRSCAELLCGNSGFSISSYWPRNGLGISCAVGGMAGLTIADRGPGSLLPPQPLSATAAHTTAASARFLNEHTM